MAQLQVHTLFGIFHLLANRREKIIQNLCLIHTTFAEFYLCASSSVTV
jgi:hypothetical protein